MRDTKLKIFTGSSNRALAEEICSSIGVPLGDATVNCFPDGESFVKINENIRGADTYFIQSTCPPTNHHLMELLIMIDAAKRASTSRITAVIPFYGYARQDRKDQPRVPITAKLVADLLTAAGANRVTEPRTFLAPFLARAAAILRYRAWPALPKASYTPCRLVAYGKNGGGCNLGQYRLLLFDLAFVVPPDDE